MRLLFNLNSSRAAVIVAALFLSSCDQVFYQPMREIVATPAQLGLEWDAAKITVPGGNKISLWHLKTQQQIQGVVIHAHGNAENRSTHMNFVAWMTNAGFDVVVFDYRGYGDSDGLPARSLTVEDTSAVISWVKSNRRFSRVPVVVLGQSLGGAVSTTALGLYAQKYPAMKPVDALIVESTFSSYRRIARAKLSELWITWPLQWPLSFLVSDDLSPVDVAPAIDIPILQFHSRRDHVVPIGLGRELFAAFGSAKKQFIEIPTPGHLVAFAVESDEYRDLAVDFIRSLDR